MNIHEYQAKSLLKQFKVPVSEGILVEQGGDTAALAGAAAEKLKKDFRRFTAIKKAWTTVVYSLEDTLRDKKKNLIII